MKRMMAGVLLAAGLPVWCGCAGATVQSAGTETSAQSEAAANGSLKFYETVHYEYKTDVSQALEYLLTGMNPAYLLLANREHPLGKAYQPDETVVQDGKLLTGEAAGSAFDLGLAMLKVLKGTKTADEVRVSVCYRG